jgi:tetratricopeptide (TPR) repeat protein
VGAGVAVKVRAFAVLALIAFPRVGGAADEITAATVAAVQRWVTAVEKHEPGRRDAEVEMVLALTFDKRRELNAGMAFFLGFLLGKPADIKNPSEKWLAAVAGATRQVPGPNPFLKRAAVLHADTAFIRELDDAKPAEPVRPPTGLPYSPLLSQRTLHLNRDGEILGDSLADWNWPFARSLIALVFPRPADDPFVGAWYHATSAFMLQHGLYGEVLPHLESATALLPDDARVLFDRASYAELQGLPRIQVLLSDADVLAIRAQRAGRSSLIRTPATLPRRLGIPPEEEANEEAERLFRRALRADPSFVEARVRLGRLLGVRKRHDEAAAELATALAANPSGAVLFYAHLFAGRSAQALGKIADAAGHYKAADLLFPGAQSSGLARSQAALLESDVPAALESIQHVDTSTDAQDPWGWYHLGAGRDADALLREMWAQVLKF